MTPFEYLLVLVSPAMTLTHAAIRARSANKRPRDRAAPGFRPEAPRSRAGTSAILFVLLLSLAFVRSRIYNSTMILLLLLAIAQGWFALKLGDSPFPPAP